MEPFEVVCPACQKSLRVKQPDLVGKRVACPQCKEKFTIERPAADDLEGGAPEMPPVMPAVDAPASGGVPSFGESSYATSTVARPKKADKNQQLIIFGGIGATMLVLGILFLVNSQMKASEQARLRANLSANERKQLEKLEQEGKTVELKDKTPFNTRPVAVDPIPKKPAKEMPRVEEAEALHGHLQDLKRAHKQSLPIVALAAELARLQTLYRREEITPEDFVAKVNELAAKSEATERTLVKKALTDALVLERPGVEAEKIAAFVEIYDKAVLENRVKEWKLNDETRKLVHDAVKKTLGDNSLGGNKSEMEDLLVRFSEEYY
jgi:hypothetical protein